MSNRIFWLLALLMGLGWVCMALPYAALSSAYSTLRDGRHVVGTVTHVEPHRTYVTADVSYVDFRGQPAHHTEYGRLGAEASALAVGKRVDLLETSSKVIQARSLEKERPPVLLLAGAIFFFLLTLACIVLQRVLRAGVPRPGEPLDVVIVSIARTRNVRLAGAMLFLVFAAGFVALAFADPEATGGEQAGILAIGALSLGVAGWLGAIAYRLRDPRNNPVIELVTQRPRDIAWCHVLEQRSRGVTVLTAVLWQANGNSVGLRLTREDAEVVLAEIARRAPHAARGYSPEIEKQYRENPARWQPAG